MKRYKWSVSFLLALTLVGIYYVAPTFIYFTQPMDVKIDDDKLAAVIPDWLPEKHVKLGLDLQGGVQLVLGVETSNTVRHRLERIGTEVMRLSTDEKLGVKTAYLASGIDALHIELDEKGDLDKIRQEVKKDFPGLKQTSAGERFVEFGFEDDQIKRIRDSALEQAERVIRTRVDRWGVTEPLITRRADGSIMVQLPGFKDPEKAKELLGRTAQLQFKIVDDEFTGFDELAKNVPEGIRTDRAGKTLQFTSENKDAVLAFVKDKVPQDHELLFERKELAGGKKSEFISVLVHAATEISGEDVLDSGVTLDSSQFRQDPAVSLKFTGPGGKRFGEVTGANVDKRMAIVLDNEVVSAPKINTKISGGNAIITLGSGNYNDLYTEANELSLILKSGALPAKITVLEERQVGATLGPELAQQGVMAALLGLVFVFVFMLWVYRIPGLLACITLVLNALFLLVVMTAFGFALTLPGIAGLILTIGMAVDSNVLINERIRIELKAGKTARKAVDIGFDRVFWTIVDANVTTLIAGAVLLSTSSSGPIKGFAVALIWGIIVSLFTALYCARLMFNLLLTSSSNEEVLRSRLGAEAAKKAHVFNIDFHRYTRGFVVTSLVVIVGVLGVFFTKGFNWSVDFKGGTEMELLFAKDVDSSQIREVGQKAGIDDLSIQALEGKKNRYLLRFEKGEKAEGEEAAMGPAIKLRELVKSELKDFGADVLRTDFVGPQVGGELKAQGIQSVFYAVLGVVLYVFVKFSMGFVPGSAFKMIIDTFMVLGFYAFFWRSFDLTSVAAILTVIGYSINDAVVVYDRIRENMEAGAGRANLRELVNRSLNETFVRTVNTSLITFISLLGIVFLGTSQLLNFALAMCVGIVSATLSSIFIGAMSVIWYEKWAHGRAQSSALTKPQTTAGK